jgi:hypothetical protein
MPRRIASPTLASVLPSIVLAGLLAPPLASAAPGCWEGETCAPATTTGPCDASCASRYCIDGQCASVATCAVPCETGGGCPSLLLGNFRFVPDGPTSAECVYQTGGACGPLTIRPGGLSAEAACLARGGDASAWLEGDCDGDGVTNVVEGASALCEPQTYVGPSGVPIPTCDAGSCAPATCAEVGTLGGGACADTDAAAYACNDTLDCPSHPLTPATACVLFAEAGGVPLGACHYGDVCVADLDACFELTTADPDRWLPSAYERGDCDGDGLANAEDAMDCGLELATWGDVPHTSVATSCTDPSTCILGSCSPLGFCVSPDAIGVACDPAAPRAMTDCSAVLGVPARCVEAGTGPADAVGVCIPSGAIDAMCALRARACFVPGAEPTESYLRGDCDGDGLANAGDDLVCSAAPGDASVARDAARAELDGGGGPGPSPSGGGGCACRARTGGAGGPIAATSIVLGAMIAEARRRRSRRR